VKTIRHALLFTLTVGSLTVGCADEKHAPEQPEKEPEAIGTLALPLETTAASGTRYRLRQAVFLVDRSNFPGFFGGNIGAGGITGGFIGGLFGGGGATVGGIAGGIVGGDGTVAGGAVTAGGITGGTPGGVFAGPGGGATGGILAGGSTGGSMGVPGGLVGGPSDAGSPQLPSDAGPGIPPIDPFPIPPPGIPGIPGLSDLFGFTRELAIDSEDNPLAPEIRKEIPAGSYRIFLQDGWFLERVVGNETFEVDATLVGSSTQFFSIASGSDTQIFFTFETAGEIVRFEKRGGLTIRPTVIETPADGGMPEAGAPPVDFGAVIELNLGALSSFTLSDVLAAVATNAGLPSNPTLLYQTLIDSYASTGNARLPEARHCGDEVTGGVPSLNGFPLRCDRREAQQFGNLNRWSATAVVSRIDLAPEDGSNCGQQRMVFANVSGGRMFLILEAQIPNPHPECGIDGCRPLAQAWRDLSTSDPGSRGRLLREMFLTGSEQLSQAGFSAFMSANNMTVGSGTIRTNNFDDDPWTLREFKVVVNEGGGDAVAVPFPVAESPRGELWNDLSTLPMAEACRANFLDALEGLLTDDPSRMRFVVDDACKNSESQNDAVTEDYATHLAAGSGAFAREIEERITGTGLTATDIANRARFGGSCIGCHQEASGLPLGRGVRAPLVRDFPQILEFPETCADGTFNCSAISPGLRDVFLPHRQEVHDALLARPMCGASVDAGALDDADVGDADVDDAGVDASGPRDAGIPSADTGIVQPPALAPIEELMAADQRARSGLSGLTIGGQPARTTH
jgi:hypothetical protein